jgi:hypothetical protein
MEQNAINIKSSFTFCIHADDELHSSLQEFGQRWPHASDLKHLSLQTNASTSSWHITDLTWPQLLDFVTSWAREIIQNEAEGWNKNKSNTLTLQGSNSSEHKLVKSWPQSRVFLRFLLHGSCSGLAEHATFVVWPQLLIFFTFWSENFVSPFTTITQEYHFQTWATLLFTGFGAVVTTSHGLETFIITDQSFNVFMTHHRFKTVATASFLGQLQSQGWTIFQIA